jgi:hypothetical protein
MKQVSEDCSIELPHLRELECGQVKPTWEELELLADRYCISVRDLLPRRDDRDRGVKILRDRDAVTIEQLRAGRIQYTYSSRATSSTLPDFRPVELLLHLNDPEAVSLNKGHFFHQYTQVLDGGPVGFLWRWEDQVYSEVLQRGDSWMIPGLIPHWFYSPDPNRLGRILAVTFGCHLTGDAREELALLGPTHIHRIIEAGDYYDG